MSKGKKRAMLALALAPLCAAAAKPTADETILIRLRFPYAVCAGTCSSFEMKVGPGGQVVTHGDFRNETYRFQASSSQLAAFRQALGAIRPARETRLDQKCEVRQPDGTLDPLALNPRYDDFEVRWTSDHDRVRLTGCYFAHLPTRKIVQNALRALGADPFFGYKEGRSPCGPKGGIETPSEGGPARQGHDNKITFGAIVCHR